VAPFSNRPQPPAPGTPPWLAALCGNRGQGKPHPPENKPQEPAARGLAPRPDLGQQPRDRCAFWADASQKTRRPAGER